MKWYQSSDIYQHSAGVLAALGEGLGLCLGCQVGYNLHDTVKPVYNGHLRDKVSAIVIDRWSLSRRPVYNGQNLKT